MIEHPVIQAMRDALDHLVEERDYWAKQYRDSSEACSEFAREVADLEENENVVAALYWQEKYETLEAELAAMKKDARRVSKYLKLKGMTVPKEVFENAQAAADRILAAKEQNEE
jgi:uncharacterized protein (DUF1697 family)